MADNNQDYAEQQEPENSSPDLLARIEAIEAWIGMPVQHIPGFVAPESDPENVSVDTAAESVALVEEQTAE